MAVIVHRLTNAETHSMSSGLKLIRLATSIGKGLNETNIQNLVLGLNSRFLFLLCPIARVQLIGKSWILSQYWGCKQASNIVFDFFSTVFSSTPLCAASTADWISTFVLSWRAFLIPPVVSFDYDSCWLVSAFSAMLFFGGQKSVRRFF